jgi:aldose 1-epimerase
MQGSIAHVTDPAPPVVLRSGVVTVTVHPAAGGRIGQIEVARQPLLVDVPDLAGSQAHPMMWGSFLMAPWVGRIRQGRFVVAGTERRLPINHHDGVGSERAHAIHGLVFDRAVHTVDATSSSWIGSVEMPWQFGGVVTQTVAIFDDRVVCTAQIEATAGAFPAEIGWHPWFRKPDGLDFSPIEMYERDEFGLPTGDLVEPSDGPWDDCFVNTEPIVLRYDRPIAPAVTVRSGCDHVVVYDLPRDSTCVEPQSGPPDAFNLQPHVVSVGSPLARTMSISW